MITLGMKVRKQLFLENSLWFLMTISRKEEVM